VVTFLDDGKIVITNQRAEELIGLSRQELLGESIYTFLVGGDAVRHEIESYLQDGKSGIVGTTSHCRMRDARGKTIELEMAVSASKGEARPMFTVIFRDRPDSA
jgi:PAS domain S-box-containing protein